MQSKNEATVLVHNETITDACRQHTNLDILIKTKQNKLYMLSCRTLEMCDLSSLEVVLKEQPPWIQCVYITQIVANKET